jgi:hypothetical protein
MSLVSLLLLHLLQPRETQLELHVVVSSATAAAAAATAA